MVILYNVQSFLSSRMGLNFRHLSSCDTIGCNLRDYLFSENLSIDAIWMSSCIATSILVHNGKYVQKLLQLVNSFW